MKIGLFDSGLGGLVVAKGLFGKLPRYDYFYLGDTKRVPYGNRSAEAVFEFTSAAVRAMFNRGCALVILACNTSSALALRRIQREMLPAEFPDRRVLGVIVPTLEEVTKKYPAARVGILSTANTARSHIYRAELKKLSPQSKIFEQEAPLLVPLIENNALHWSENILKSYLKPLTKNRVEALVLACTHYPLLKGRISKLLGPQVKVLAQTEFLPRKLEDYLKRHPEIERRLGKNGRREFFVTDLSGSFSLAAQRLFGKKLTIKKIVI